ncbi:MAG: nitrous oxide reductase accessory protein NosL [Phycisphaeraceae bacterium]|nr:nitrous oxide reductase accessory protein NosL [Phycisphaerales bacterium]MCB9842302.1 nitrous oxide reductase accessory protein NosL [Phycisphaeraceae bacterium]
MKCVARILVLSPMMLAPSCARPDPLGAPKIALDQTSCAECGMIVSDERYACASIVRIDDRSTEPRVFDDVNCLVLHEVTGSNPPEVLARWVHDKDSRQWLAAESAHFVWAKELNTPMMSHIAAFASGDSADAFARESEGQRMTYAEVRWLYTPEHLRGPKP